MKKFTYIIQAEFGMHARPAGWLVKLASHFTSTILIGKQNTMVRATNILQVMALSIQKGDEIIISLHGEDEDAAMQSIKDFLHKNL